MYVNSKYAPHSNANICFECAKATGRCSWSKKFEPVPGWTAEPVSRPDFDTYHITACPEFVKG